MTKEDLFSPVPPSDRVKQFLDRYTRRHTSRELSFLLREFPQVTDGSIHWILEGGMAIHLLYPQVRSSADFDIITTSAEMAKEFDGAGKVFDVKTTGEWMRRRGMPFEDEQHINHVRNKLFSRAMPLSLDDQTVLALGPLGIAAAKTLPWGNQPRRQQDVEDLLLLNQTHESVDLFIKELQILPE